MKNVKQLIIICLLSVSLISCSLFGIKAKHKPKLQVQQTSAVAVKVEITGQKSYFRQLECLPYDSKESVKEKITGTVSEENLAGYHSAFEDAAKQVLQEKIPGVKIVSTDDAIGILELSVSLKEMAGALTGPCSSMEDEKKCINPTQCREMSGKSRPYSSNYYFSARAVGMIKSEVHAVYKVDGEIASKDNMTIEKDRHMAYGTGRLVRGQPNYISEFKGSFGMEKIHYDKFVAGAKEDFLAELKVELAKMFK